MGEASCRAAARDEILALLRAGAFPEAPPSAGLAATPVALPVVGCSPWAWSLAVFLIVAAFLLGCCCAAGCSWVCSDSGGSGTDRRYTRLGGYKLLRE